jgi:hypothetical protein
MESIVIVNKILKYPECCPLFYNGMINKYSSTINGSLCHFTINGHL